MTSPREAAPNRDPCGRCRTRHGGNDHLCPVHGPVSAGCCPSPCRPEEWVYCERVGAVPLAEFDPAGWTLVRHKPGGVPWYRRAT